MTTNGPGNDPIRPLAGVRVLALEQMLALPAATQILSRLGAEVVKIEPPGGEGGRASRPRALDAADAEVGATFIRGNRGKKSIVLDLKQPEGVELFYRLLPRFDIFAENLRPGVTARLGIDYARVAQASPRTIYLSVSGFGNGSSPYGAYPAFAAVGEAVAGLYEFRRPEGDAPRVGASGPIGDLSAALYAAIGVLAALRLRETTGRGTHVDIAMADTALAMNDMAVNLWSMNAMDIADGRNVGVLDSFRAKDGYFVVVVIREHLWQRFCAVIGRPEWLADPQLQTRSDWSANLETRIRPAVEAWAADKTKSEAAAALATAGVPAGPSNEPVDVANDPHYRVRQMIESVPGLSGDPVLVVGNPIKFLGEDLPEPGGLPTLGEHTRALLAGELGLDDDMADEYFAQGGVA
jgi:crotonobetainyl-CoA:carnitine CoA-transferase CaiB-like acyl-CoA transferase